MAEKKKSPGRVENLDPVKKGSPEAKARGKQGGIKSGIVKREKKRMSQIYAEFLDRDHEIVDKKTKKKVSGPELLSMVMTKVLSRGDSAAVSLLKEIREATEGTKTTIDFANIEESKKEIQSLFGVEVESPEAE
jgi:ABC-type transporter Mla MlaB component